MILNYVYDGSFRSDVIAFDEFGITSIKKSDYFEYSIEKDTSANINCLYVKNVSNINITRLKYMIIGQVV